MSFSKAQLDVYNSPNRFRVLITGIRFGKTHLAMYELLRFASRNNNGKIFYVAPTYRMSKEIMWKQIKRLTTEKRWIKYANETELTLVLRNGSQISLKGADKSPDNLRGVGLDFLLLDEYADIPVEAWTEVLRPTISDKHVTGNVLFIGTPRGYGNWSYDIYQKGLGSDKEWKSFKYTTLDGGQVDEEEIKQAMNDLDERTFRQEYLASFETYSGVVYYNFDRELNVKECKYDKDAIIHIGLDFNIDPMSACLFHVKNGSNTDEFIDELLTRYPKQKMIVYPDPASRQRKTSAGGRTDLTILQNAGLNVKAKNTHALVRDRVNSVNSKLKSFDGKRSIFINPSCKTLINSLQKQVYKENTTQPEKGNGYDHMTDALGYAIEYLFPITSNLPKSQPKRFS